VFSMLFRMSDVISGVLAMRIMVQFIGQAVGVILLRKRNGTSHLPYKMPLYPLPVIIVIILWLFVFFSTGMNIMLSFLVLISAGVLVYFLFAKYSKHWPYAESEKAGTEQ